MQVQITGLDGLRRNLSEFSDRRLCVECGHYRPGRCNAHRAAGLMTPIVGRDLATLPQRCPAFAPS